MHIGINALSLSETIAGGGRYISGLIRAVGILNEDFILTIFIRPGSGLVPEFCKGNIRVVYCGRWSRIRPLRILWEHAILPVHIIVRKIDLLHSPGFVSPLWLGGRCKSVVTVFDMTFFLFPKYHTFWKKIYFTKLIPYTILKASKIITISYSSKEDIIRYFRIPDNKIVVTYLGIDVFYPENEGLSRARIKEVYGVKEDFILFVGVLEPRKNLQRLLRAYDKVIKNEKSRYKLVVVGKKGWGYEGIFKTIKQLGLEEDVIFTGHVPEKDLWLFYKEAVLFVYPSLYEGLGIPILEAMSSGTPVITSNLSSMPEVAGDAAIKVDPWNTDEIAEAISKVLHDKELKNKLIQAGFERVRLFSWEKMARETLAVYREVLNQKPVTSEQ